MTRFNRFLLQYLICLYGFMIGCSSENTPQHNANVNPENQATQHADAENALVIVNGDPIYQSDVDSMIEQTFSQSDQLILNDDIQRKVLESLVTSKAIMQEAKKTFSEQEIIDIQKRVKSFEEELYVKSYLQEHAVPVPVSNEMVERYYEDHPERFGATKVKIFEMLRSTQKLNETQRDKLLSELDNIKQSEDWSSKQVQWQKTFGLSYLRGEVRAGLFNRSIDQQMTILKKGEVSNVIFVDELPYLIRIVKEKMLPPKSLSEVSSEIRKSLAPFQLRKAVKDISAEVVSRADIKNQAQNDSSN